MLGETKMPPQCASLFSFNGSNGKKPMAELTFDANGNLIGTTESGGANNFGTVFEVVDTGTATAPNYASAPTTLVNFNAANGESFSGRLIADANGDLFGKTQDGGTFTDGTVFELKNNGTRSAPNPRLGLTRHVRPRYCF
jgi:uncharacterized repeat protein (TIGR03803 family)